MDYKIVVFDEVTGLATLRIPTVPKIIEGLDELVQVVVLSFLRNPGQSVLAPFEGSGLRGDIGKYNFTADGGGELAAHAIQRTRFVQQEVISRQSPDSGTPSSRLKQLTVLNFALDVGNGRAVLQVQVTSEAGDSADILV